MTFEQYLDSFKELKTEREREKFNQEVVSKIFWEAINQEFSEINDESRNAFLQDDDLFYQWCDDIDCTDDSQQYDRKWLKDINETMVQRARSLKYSYSRWPAKEGARRGGDLLWRSVFLRKSEEFDPIIKKHTLHFFEGLDRQKGNAIYKTLLTRWHALLDDIRDYLLEGSEGKWDAEDVSTDYYEIQDTLKWYIILENLSAISQYGFLISCLPKWMIKNESARKILTY